MIKLVPYLLAFSLYFCSTRGWSQDIEKALTFLTSQQLAGGSFHQNPELPSANVCGTNSFAGLAMLEHGANESDSPYHAHFLKATDYVISCRNDAGVFLTRPGDGNARSICHNLATLFIAKCRGKLDSHRNSVISAALPAAVEVILDAQKIEKAADKQGGWRYLLTDTDSDLIQTGFAVAALHTAREAGAEVPDETFALAAKYILKLQIPANGGFCYHSPREKATFCRTAVGLTVLQMCGLGDSSEAGAASDFLLNQSLDNGSPAPRLHPRPVGGYEMLGSWWAAEALANRSSKERETFRKWAKDHWWIQKRDGSFRGVLPPMESTISWLLAVAIFDNIDE